MFAVAASARRQLPVGNVAEVSPRAAPSQQPQARIWQTAPCSFSPTGCLRPREAGGKRPGGQAWAAGRAGRIRALDLSTRSPVIRDPPPLAEAPASSVGGVSGALPAALRSPGSRTRGENLANSAHGRDGKEMATVCQGVRARSGQGTRGPLVKVRGAVTHLGVLVATRYGGEPTGICRTIQALGRCSFRVRAK